MTNRWLPRLAALALLPLLSSCIFFETPTERAMRKDPNFQAGYSDGCASASASGANLRTDGQVRDAALYQSSKPYRSGWAAGYSTCNNRIDAPDPGMGGTPAPRMPGVL
ncbi:MAG: hypothetical protein WDN03_00815 [Rhizomicrobium sp.]